MDYPNAPLDTLQIVNMQISVQLCNSIINLKQWMYTETYKLLVWPATVPKIWMKTVIRLYFQGVMKGKQQLLSFILLEENACFHYLYLSCRPLYDYKSPGGVQIILQGHSRLSSQSLQLHGDCEALSREKARMVYYRPCVPDCCVHGAQ